MAGPFRAGAATAVGIALIVAATAVQAILLETTPWTLALAGTGLVLTVAGALGLRRELAWLLRRRRVEIAAFALGAVGVLAALAYFSARFPVRLDLTEAGLHSLAPQTEAMLDALDKPVHVVFFHDHLMLETRELYELMAARSELLTAEFHDPTLNPARARTLGVQFAGTAVLRSEDRHMQVHGASEAEIANGILRVTQSSRQRVCFLEGHDEADPFSLESHDHMEANAGADHAHGLGAEFILHERHGLAKARASLETFNFEVTALSLTRGGDPLEPCALLVVAGPKTALLPAEVTLVRDYLRAGGNGLFLLDPFVTTGLEPVLLEYGIVLDDNIVLDETNHYWTDVSAPAVARYNNHQVTRELALTFYPGVRSLSPTDVRIPGTSVVPLVNSSAASYGETDPTRAERDRDTDRAGPLTLVALSNRRPPRDTDATQAAIGGDGARVRARVAALIGDAPSRVSAPSRIAVAGDADFATNSFFHFLGNGSLFLNTVNYLTARENLIGVEPRTRDLPKLSVTNRQIKGTFVISMVLVPGLLALAGTLAWWRQR